MYFLGREIDVDQLPSDIKYGVDLLSSKEAKSFYSGLKALVAIHRYNIDEEKRALCKSLLQPLLNILPSLLKESGDGNFQLNKTRLEKLVKENIHPLHVLPSSSIESIPGGINVKNAGLASPSLDSPDEEDIRIIAVEDLDGGEKALIEEIQKTKISKEAREHEPGTSGEPEKESPREEEEEEWVDASQLRDSVEMRFLFDDHGQISKEFDEGLDLINPMELEASLDRAVSSAGGYQDIYRQSPGTSPAPPDEGIVPASITGALDGVVDLHKYTRLEMVNSKDIDKQRCALGDGDVDEESGMVYRCKKCKAVYHPTCCNLSIMTNSGCCMVCDSPWS